MITEPTIVHRAEQPYLAIPGVVTMQTIGQIADRLPELYGWLGEHGIEPTGAPFFKYNVIDMEQRLDMEVGFPVAVAVAGEGEVVAGVLPAGRYASVHHVGHPDELVTVTGALLDWAAERGLRGDATETEEGDEWGCRLEVYNNNPADEPDMTKWETDLYFRLAD